MNTMQLLQQENPLKQEPPQLKKAIARIAESFCLRHSIDPKAAELVVHFGYLNDENNHEAISTWIYNAMSSIDADSQTELTTILKIKFENELHDLITQSY